MYVLGSRRLFVHSLYSHYMSCGGTEVEALTHIVGSRPSVTKGLFMIKVVTPSASAGGNTGALPEKVMLPVVRWLGPW